MHLDMARAIARAVDGWGYEALLAADHLQATEGSGGGPSLDPWLVLAVLATETHSVTLGTLVSPVTFRPPAMLARLAATLQVASNGRCELGVGAGWFEPEHRAHGLAYPSGPERVTMLEEQLVIISDLLAGRPASLSGIHHHLEGCWLWQGVEHLPVRLLVGGRPTSRRILDLAARFADEYVVTRGTPQQVRVLRGLLDHAVASRASAPALGRYARVALRDITPTWDYPGARVPPDQSDDQWIVGSVWDVREQVDVLGASGVDRIYVAVHSDRELPMLERLADIL